MKPMKWGEIAKFWLSGLIPILIIVGIAILPIVGRLLYLPVSLDNPNLYSIRSLIVLTFEEMGK